jgi:hypothetical protein
MNLVQAYFVAVLASIFVGLIRIGLEELKK